jgi:hypothetical protein
VHPFTTIAAMAGNPIYCPADSSPEQMELVRQQVQAEMDRVQQVVENWFGPDSKRNEIPWFNSRVSLWTGKPICLLPACYPDVALIHAVDNHHQLLATQVPPPPGSRIV